MAQGNEQIVSYRPAGPTIKRFHESSAFVRGIMGPLGSGKSTACVIEILRRAQMQKPGPDGVRRTRWAIIRNSYGELKSTTLKTYSVWSPLEYGKINMDSPFVHHVRTDAIDMEVLFIALDRPEDARKLLSLEITGCWLNEIREIPKAILDAVTGRVGRYPSKAQGGATWSGVIADTNPPDAQSYYYRLAEEETPDGWEFFKQPSGLSAEAENLENLPPNYYQRLLAGKDEDWIKIYCRGEYGFLQEGQSVFPMYRDRLHVSETAIEPIPKVPLLIGADFGLTPAAVIGQKLADGRWLILDELVTDNCGIQRFAELLSSHVTTKYPEHDVAGCWADPAGNQRSMSDERTALEIMNASTPWKWRPAPGDNSLTMRLEVVRSALNRLIDGNPGLLVSPACPTLRKGFAGGYQYRLIKSSNGAQTHETPNKNTFSHPHDALQYLLLGGGEFSVVLNRQRRDARAKGPRIAKGIDFNPYERRGTFDVYAKRSWEK